MGKAEREPPRRDAGAGADKGARVFVLPVVEPLGAARGGRIVRHAVGLTFAFLAAIALVALVAAFTVSMDVTVDAAGVLEPTRLWPARTQEAGLVGEVLVRTGDTVARGQVVARLDSLAMQEAALRLDAQVEAKELQYRTLLASGPMERAEQSERRARAEARVISARATLRQRLVEGESSTAIDSVRARYRPGEHIGVDLAMADLLAAESETREGIARGGAGAIRRLELAKLQSELEHLRAEHRFAIERLHRTSVRAPASGVVLTSQPEAMVGAYVRVGDPIVEVADLRQWRVVMLVPERDVHRIRVGDRVKVEVQAFAASERDPLRGHVSAVASEPLGSESSDPASGQAPRPSAAAGPRLYRVTVALNDARIVAGEAASFRLGYTVQGRIVTRSGLVASLLWDYVTDALGR
jgi:multidrug resistance efflux pump